MSTITIEPALQKLLAAITQATPMVDKDGNVLGTFTPLSKEDAELLAMAAKVFDPNELDRIEREQSGKGIPYAEVKKRLQALESHP